MGTWDNYRKLSDDQLTAKLEELVASERRRSVEVIACLGEFDRRKLYAKRSYHSLFEYCVGRLRYSEGATARRIHAARAAREFPDILSYLAQGDLSLTAVSLLAPHLTRENRGDLLSRAQGKSRRELERMIAEIASRPDRADSISYVNPPPRKVEPAETEAAVEDLFAAAAVPTEPTAGLPAPAAPAGIPAAGGDPAPPPEAVSAEDPPPAGPVRVRFAFTADEGLLKAVERVRQLLRHKHPLARLEDVFQEAVLEYLERHDPARRPARRRPRREPPEENGEAKRAAGARESRRIPAWVRDQVWKRDGGRCRFTAEDGRRCAARSQLEFDHVRPWALGGCSDDPDNVRLLCRTHNQLRAREMFPGLAPERR